MRFIRLFLKIVGVLVGIAALLFAVFLAWGYNKSQHAKEDSIAFCEEFAVGSPVADMVAAAQSRLIIHTEDKEERVHEFIFPSIGLGMMKCVVNERGGKIGSKKTYFQDD